MLCPCGSNTFFTHCCQPFLQREKTSSQPETAEQLMRSRFSAYATKNGQYIYNTYANATRISQSLGDIQQWADECIWLALEIRKSSKAIVEFSAYYIANNTLCCLTEKSTFIIEKGLWRYLDGEISSHTELSQVKLNEICPCNNYSSAFSVKKGKKFKHCCGR